MGFIEQAREIIGAAQVLTGADCARYGRDWTGKYVSEPLCVLRPGATREVSALLRLAGATGTHIVPMGGNTGLNGGTHAPGAALLSLERMNRIVEIRPEARIARVEAGVVIAALDAAAEAEGLRFPLFFGAAGSATIGGALSTNAGGSNVLRFGNARALCLGVEAVLADGTVVNLMSALHKDNTGYDLRDLLIGSEGTLGIITGAVVKLVPRSRAVATAMVALASLEAALALLNRLQAETGGAVEAFEYMPAVYFDRLAELRPELRAPFAESHAVNVLVEIASSAEAETTPGPDGTIPLVARLDAALADAYEAGLVQDAVRATSEAQRRAMWAAREAAAEVAFSRSPQISADIALPLDRVADFYTRLRPHLDRLDPEALETSVAHLGDGNIHYVVFPSHADPAHLERITQAIENETAALGGSFSAEHGIGLSKRASMGRHKDPGALATMRLIKAALDPKGILNPGKVLPG